jgi:hypothetical protein
MDRKNFLKKGLMGTGMFITSAALGDTIKNDIDELKPLEPMGLNHIPTIPLALPITIIRNVCTLAYYAC